MRNPETELVKHLAKVAAGESSGKDIVPIFYKCRRRRQLAETLSYHELDFFLCFLLKDAGETLPEYLAAHYYRYAARYMILEKEFFQIMEAAQKNGLSIIPIKGFSYSHKYYRRFGLRPLTDIDLLVKPEDLPAAGSLLERLGYKKDFSGGKESYWRKEQCHFEFVKTTASGKVLAELHWALDFKRRGHYPLQSAWERLREENAEGRKITVLSPEDTLFSLALHQRRFGKMLNAKYACDSGLIIKNNALDWKYIQQTAYKEKIRASLYFLLKQVEIVLDLELKEQLAGLCLPAWQRLAIDTVIRKYIFSPPRGEKVYYLYLLCHFLLYDNISYPIKYLLNIPIEQFAKFFGLELYAERTHLLYRARFFYIPYKIMEQAVRSALALVF